VAAKIPETPDDKTESSIPYRSVATIGDCDSTIAKEGLRHLAFYFNDIDTSDTWASGFSGNLRVLGWTWSPSTDANIRVQCTPSSGLFTWVSSASNQEGWLHVWVRA
jgi:hypothetical protein